MRIPSRLACLSLLAALGCSSEQPETKSSGSERDASRARDSGGNRDAGSKGDGDDKSDEDKDDNKGETRRDARVPLMPKPDDGVDKCAGIAKDAPAAVSTPVDVIFVIDTSGSMLDEAAKVQANIAKFVGDFADSNADTRVIMITQNDPAAGTNLGADSSRYKFIGTRVDSGALYTVATTTLPGYLDVLRPNAVTHFVMITDDNDLLPPAFFQSTMEGIIGHEFVLHAIASESVNGRPCTNEDTSQCTFIGCGATNIGSNYNMLAQTTGGEQISICTADWTGVFERLKTAVVEAVPLPCNYPLAEATSSDFDKTKVQVVYTPEGGEGAQFPKATSRDECGDKTGWFYDDEAKPTSITLCPAACEKAAAGGAMEIAFGCEPEPIVI